MKPTQKALRQCAEWLAQYVRMGGSKANLGALEKLWWDGHDERGNLKIFTKPENINRDYSETAAK